MKNFSPEDLIAALTRGRALVARARELLVETADAGEHQEKLLTILFLLSVKKRLLEGSREEARKIGINEAFFESPIFRKELAKHAGQSANQALAIGTVYLQLLDSLEGEV